VELGGACVRQIGFAVGRAGYARWPRCHSSGRPAVGLGVGEEHLLARRRQAGHGPTVRWRTGWGEALTGDHRPWWRKKRSMLSGSRTRARSFMRPPHAGHWSTVNPNVRRKSSDHPMYRHRLPEGGGLAALVNAGGAGRSVRRRWRWGALGDGSAGAGGMISGRQWAAAARTPL